MNHPAPHLDCLIAKAGQLYTLPAVAMQVLELTGDPSVDTHALKKCVENDPALTTKILQVVNSSLFGLSGHVSDLNQALALLGIKPLKLLVLGFSLPTRFFQDIAGEVLSDYWRHTLTKAVAAREITETLWRQAGDEAFIAGLLQDLGSLLLIQELGEPYVELLRKVRTEGADLLGCERRALGFDHTTLTAAILRRWRLPEVLSAAVEVGTGSREAHWPASQTPDLRQVLQLAELVARLLADAETGVLGELLATGRQFCSLTPARLDDLVSTLGEKVRQLADVFSLQLPGGADYVDILARAHRRLAEVASEAAAEMIAGRQHAEAARGPAAEAILEQITSLCDAAASAVQRTPAPATTVAAIS
ncbi:MAG: HDOD domain-containing protein, partial [Pirellulales bacterium]|nr:HDOD domain-containing protein [Pirellulales bacterium]